MADMERMVLLLLQLVVVVVFSFFYRIIFLLLLISRDISIPVPCYLPDIVNATQTLFGCKYTIRFPARGELV